MESYVIPFSSICRTCMYPKNDLKSVYEASVAEMLMRCTSLQIMEGDGMPSFMCSQCVRSVNRLYSFKEQCEESDALLRQYVSEGLLPAQEVKGLIFNKVDLPTEDNQSQSVQEEMVLTEFSQQCPLMDDNETFPQLPQHSEDEDTADCPELDLEPECNLVENALAALQDLEKRGDTFDTGESQWLHSNSMVDNFMLENTHLVNLPKYVSKNGLSKKNVIDMSDRKYHCAKCSEAFINPSDLSIHMSLHPADGRIECKACQKHFSHFRMLRRHIKIHMSWKAHKCHICSKEFTEAGTLNKHIKRHAGPLKMQTHKCNICGKGYHDAHYLAIHLRKHTGEKPFSCQQCSKTFTDHRLLASHLRTHNQDKIHKCIFCSKRFNHSSTLTTHLRTHTGEKPYICNICGKHFIQSSNLSLHMRTHTGIRPYFCKTCKKSFASCSTLAYHLRTHTGEKPYLCSVCGKSFARSEDVTLHMRTHTGERPYQCTVCSKRFTTSSHKNQHMLVHTGKKPHACKLCKKQNVTLSKAKQHMLKEHDIKVDDSNVADYIESRLTVAKFNCFDDVEDHFVDHLSKVGETPSSSSSDIQ